MKTKIDKVGFEIEGEFDNKTIEYLASVGSMKYDGSLRNCGDTKHGCRLDHREFNSIPYVKSGIWRAKKAVFIPLDKAYKAQKFHFNNSCGFHIHISFRPQRPPEILSTQFCDFFHKEMERVYNGVLKRRQNNRYCPFVYSEKEIFKPTEKFRAISYEAYYRHKTIEFRIFPATKPMIMYDFVLFTIKTIEKFLKKELKADFRTEIDDKDEVINQIEYKTRNYIDEDEFSDSVVVKSDEIKEIVKLKVVKNIDIK